MATYMDEDHDELMPKRGSVNNTRIYDPIKAPNTMNTRAPTDLHTRLNTSDSLDAPDDEGGAGVGIVSPANGAHNMVADSDHESYEYVNKKKKMRDRPWKKAEDYDALQADDMDIIGVKSSRSPSPAPRMVSPTNSDGHENDGGDDDDLSYENDNLDYNNHDDDLSFSSRWSQHPSSAKEVKDAHARAVSLATQKAAERDMSTEKEELPYPDEEGEGSNHSLRNSGSNNSTPAKSPNTRAADHQRVRMEALKMLELVDRKDEDGYIVKGVNGPETPLVRGGNSSASKMTNSVGNQLKKLREKTSLRKLRTPRYEAVSLSQKDDFDINPHMPPPPSAGSNTPIGKLHDIDLPYPDDYPSPTTHNDNDDNKATSKSWGSRYSIDRHMLAVNGGLTSAQVLDKMDQDHYDNLNKNTSANNMFKTSPHEQESRWNVRQGMSTDQDTIGRGRRMWNALVLNVKESVTSAKETVDRVYTRVSVSMDDGKHTTLGSHRSADHSSPRGGGVFTGVAMTNFLDRLSPKSREAHTNGENEDRKKLSKSFNWNSFNLVDRFNDQDLPDVEFTAHDDYVIEKRQRRRRFLWMILLFLTIVATMSVTLATTRNRGGTASAMYYDVGEEIKFWVTSDIPYNKAEETLLSRELSSLHARDGDFLIHLGDIHQAQVTLCPFSVYDDAAHLLKQSPVPVVVLPGNNDWNECPMPDISFEYWMEKLNKFEDNFPVDDYATVPAVNRQIGRDENFAFVQKGVLFIGLNLVDGKVHDEREWLIRHQTNVQWVEMQLSMYNVDEYRAIVLMGHAGYTAKVGDFFWPVVDDLRSTNKPVLYLHANDGKGMIEYNPVDDFPKFTAVRLEKGSRVTPTLVTVMAGPKPFRFHVDMEEGAD